MFSVHNTPRMNPYLMAMVRLQEALLKLKALIVSPSVREHTRKAELVPSLLRVVQKRTDPAACRLATSVLATLAQFQEGCLDQMAAQHSFPILVECLCDTVSLPIAELSSQQSALACITQLVSALSEREQPAALVSSLRSVKAIPAIFGMLERIGQERLHQLQEPVRNILGLIHCLADKPGVPEEIFSCTGAITTLVDMLPEPSTIPVVQSSAEAGRCVQLALSVLGNLVEGPNCPDSYVEEMLNTAVLHRILGLLEKSSRDQGAAMKLLSNLSASPVAREALRQAGAVPCMVRLLSNKSARQSASQVLSHMEEEVRDHYQLAEGRQSRQVRRQSVTSRNQ